jgi:hypothetical protein
MDREALKRSPAREAPLTQAIAIESQFLQVDYWDPVPDATPALAAMGKATRN